MIHTEKFQGHGAAILCLDVSSQNSSVSLPSSTSTLLLSGSEDGTARLWDLRDHRRRACLCIKVPGGGDVLSAVFAPPSPSTATLPNETASAFSKNCSVFLGVENAVLEYDLRHVESPIVFSEPTRDWGKVLQNQDEVNQIGLAYYSKPSNNSGGGGNKKKKNQKKKGGGGNKKRQTSTDGDSGVSLYLASCDDAGKARWTEAFQTNPSSGELGSNYENSTISSTILHHDNHGVAVLPACAFRPIDASTTRGGPSLELATGGTDCKIQLWDVFRPK